MYSDSLPIDTTIGTFCVIARARAQRILSLSALYVDEIDTTSTPSLSASSISTDVSEYPRGHQPIAQLSDAVSPISDAV